jgi:hypothetical protein
MRNYGKDLTPFSALEFLSLFNRENLSFFSARVLRRQAGVVLLCLFFYTLCCCGGGFTFAFSFPSLSPFG